MGGFLGIGGSSAKTDRKATLTGFGDLQNIFNFGMDTSKSQLATGTKTTAAGTDALTNALNYFKSLSSGNRSVVSQAIAPEANAVLAQSDAARASRVAAGTARGGGGAATEQTASDKAMAAIDNLLFGVRPAAAGAVSEIGSKIAGVGLAETNEALGFGKLAEDAASNLSDIAAKSRVESFKINQDIVGKVTDAIGNLLAAFGV